MWLLRCRISSLDGAGRWCTGTLMATAGALFSLVAFGGYICVWFSWVSSGGCAEVGVLEVVDLHYIPFDGSTKKWIYDMVSSSSEAPTCCGFFQCAESKVWSLKADGAWPPCVVFRWCRPWSRLVDSKSSGILSSEVGFLEL